MQLRDARERFERAGAAVVLVGLGTPERAGWFCQEKQLPFACLTDPAKSAFRAYGLRQGTLREVLGPHLAARWAGLQRNPETRQRAPREDWRQLPGTFVVDRRGVVRYAHRNRDAADNPPNHEVLAVLETLAKEE